MTNHIKQIPLPILRADINKIKFLYVNGQSLFKERVLENSNWKSFDIINNYSVSPFLKKLPCISSWFKDLKDFTGIKNIKHSYISILDKKSSIDWHADALSDNFHPAVLSSISTEKSFIEFEDTKYYYKEGYSYLIRSGIRHRLLNLNNDIRIVLCSTPEENKYV